MQSQSTEKHVEKLMNDLAGKFYQVEFKHEGDYDTYLNDTYDGSVYQLTANDYLTVFIKIRTLISCIFAAFLWIF